MNETQKQDLHAFQQRNKELELAVEDANPGISSKIRVFDLSGRLVAEPKASSFRLANVQRGGIFDTNKYNQWSLRKEVACLAMT